MSAEKNHENMSIPNIKYVIDKNGKAWICDAHVQEDSDLHGQRS